MEAGKELIELGCGNGRDSLFFAKNGINVTGIDASETAIDELRNTVELDNCIFICFLPPDQSHISHHELTGPL